MLGRLQRVLCREAPHVPGAYSQGTLPPKAVKLLGAVLPLSQELCFAELPHGLHLLDGLFQGLRQHGDVDPACPRFLG